MTPVETSQAIAKSSYVSIGLLITVCYGLFWVATKVATIETNATNNSAILPVIQKDISDIKAGQGRNNGVDLKQQAQIDAAHEERREIKRRLAALEAKVK